MLILLVEVVARVCGTDGGLMCDSVEDAEDEGAEAQDLYVEGRFSQYSSSHDPIQAVMADHQTYRSSAVRGTVRVSGKCMNSTEVTYIDTGTRHD